MAKKISPRQARTEKQVCSLRRDNKTADDFWMLIDGRDVTIVHQQQGTSPRASITIPRATFNRLVRWYTTPQEPQA